LSLRRGKKPPYRVEATVFADPPKSIELEIRLGRLEIVVREMSAANEQLKRHMTAIQAQLDHMAARMDRHS
jgi:hypothetical protein